MILHKRLQCGTQPILLAVLVGAGSVSNRLIRHAEEDEHGGKSIATLIRRLLGSNIRAEGDPVRYFQPKGRLNDRGLLTIGEPVDGCFILVRNRLRST